MAQPNGRSSDVVAGRGNGRPSPGVSLLTVEPELETQLSEKEAAGARRFLLSTRTLTRGSNVIDMLQKADAFGAIVLDGLLLQGLQIGPRPSLRLVEPGHVVPFTGSHPSLPIAIANLRAAMPSQIVLLDDRYLLATQLWPRLAALMYRRALESSESLAAQLAISHLSRVEERLMALMWLLADNWGHVTPVGIRLGLELTHEALGELIGAQRPTVTLALAVLADRGSLIKQDQDWLILDPPPEPSQAEFAPSSLLESRRRRSDWSPRAESESARDGRPVLPRAELARLRERYVADKALAQELQGKARQLRARTDELVGHARALSDPAQRRERRNAFRVPEPRTSR